MGKAAQARTGGDLKPHLEARTPPGPADLGEARRRAGRRREATVAAAALPAAAEHRVRPRMREVDDEIPVGVEDLRSDRDGQIETLSVGPMLAGAATVAAAAALEQALAPETRQ